MRVFSCGQTRASTQPEKATHEDPAANSQREARLMERILTGIAATVAAVVALALPAGFFASMYRVQLAALDTEAEINTRLVQFIIKEQGLEWSSETTNQLR